MGLVVLGPDVNESRAMFTPILRREVEESRSRAANPSGSSASRPLDSSTGQPAAAIRFGLAGVKGVGELAAQKIIEEREKNGAFADFPDFVQRVDGRAINKRVLEHLVKTGAFDFSGAARKSLFDSIDAALAGAAAQARDRRPASTASWTCWRMKRPRRMAMAPRRPRRGLRPSRPTASSPPPSASPSRRNCSASTSPATR